MNRLASLLAIKRQTTLAKAKPRPAAATTKPAQPASGDEKYASLSWRQSVKLPELSTIRVDDKSDPQTLELPHTSRQANHPTSTPATRRIGKQTKNGKQRKGIVSRLSCSESAYRRCVA